MTTKQTINKAILADTPSLQALCFALREEVFVYEQKVPKEEEFDEYEEASRHLVILNDQKEALGTCRWRHTEKGVKLERFAVRADWRGKGVGSELVRACLDDIKLITGTKHYLYMHAQLDAIPLYRKFGFQQVGEMFSECDILHYKMERYT